MKIENIKNANLISTEKEHLLEISLNTTLKSKFYMPQNDFGFLCKTNTSK